jgi:hypothetical protein
MEQVLMEQPDLILIATGAVESCDASCGARFTFIGVDGDSNERPIILEWMSPHCVEAHGQHLKPEIRTPSSQDRPQDCAPRLPLFESRPYRRTTYVVSRETPFGTPLDVKT